MLDEHFGGYSDDEGGIVGTASYVFICVYDLFDASNLRFLAYIL